MLNSVWYCVLLFQDYGFYIVFVIVREWKVGSDVVLSIKKEREHGFLATSVCVWIDREDGTPKSLWWESITFHKLYGSAHHILLLVLYFSIFHGNDKINNSHTYRQDFPLIILAFIYQLTRTIVPSKLERKEKTCKRIRLVIIMFVSSLQTLMQQNSLLFKITTFNCHLAVNLIFCSSLRKGGEEGEGLQDSLVCFIAPKHPYGAEQNHLQPSYVKSCWICSTLAWKRIISCVG